ncbi:alpha/beta-hydrolase [Neolentinus lepideus HHB14362 ss-1]|uniref:Alpha/beta-hydrolase n=1 Tax=Neolentinus lepideus HHB14362 ss-1 TaxID=1314782 RepID=A0A165R4C5_9AGAM|nr:alpha/beta-hydrolase [Neolentinus lepideus HHB14362 ss-1]
MADSISRETEYARLHTELRYHHVQQLSQIGDNYKLDQDSDNPPIDGSDGLSVDLLKVWTQQAKTQFDDAVEKRVFGQKNTISWENTILTFLESSAVYLRDVTKVVAAIREAKLGNEKKAIKYLEEADTDIQGIAKVWGFDYVTICDLFQRSPDGQEVIVGPFCGAFSKNMSFVGIAFKGTTSTPEWNTDLNRDPKATGDSSILWNTNVSEGVSNGLFGTYGDWGVPMDHIVEFLQESASLLPEGSTKLVVHSTGHSLGASYATLCYAQLLLYYSTNPVEWTLGDMYTYGSPRVAENNFTSQLQTALKTAPGSTWRIVNRNDSVTAIVPAPKDCFGEGDPNDDDPRVYIHTDTGYRISANASPVLLDSEIGQDPGPAPKTVEYLWDDQHVKDHMPPEYWPALLVANGIPN